MFTGLSSRLPIDAVKNPRRLGKFTVARTDSSQTFSGTQSFSAVNIATTSLLTLGASATISGSPTGRIAYGGVDQAVWNSGIGFAVRLLKFDIANQDVVLSKKAAAILQQGDVDAAAPVAQTSSVQSVVAGTSNTAGATRTYTGSQGTGTGVGGSHIFQVAPAGSTGTAQNALVTAFTINGDGTSTFAYNQYGQLGTAAGVVVSLPRSYSAVYNG